MLKRFCGILMGLLLLGTTVQAADYYVDCNTGKDYFVSGSASSPYKTIQKAAKNLKAGDRLIVKPGVYYGPINITAKGTEQNPIVIIAEDKGEDKTIITNANKNVREKKTAWTQYDADKNIWVISYKVEKNANIDDDNPSWLIPARVLVNDADIMAFQSLESLSSGIYSKNDENKTYTPGYSQGYYYDHANKKLYVKLRTDNKYGSSNPNECVMKIAPSAYTYISKSNGWGGSGFKGDAMGEDSFNICIGNYDADRGNVEAAESYYVQIEGFTFETPGYAGVFCRSSDVTVKNCYFKGCRTAVRGAARIREYDKIFSKNITIEHCDWSSYPSFDDAMELIAICSDSDKTDYVFSDIEAEGYKLSGYYWWQRKGFELNLSYEIGSFTNYMGENWIIRHNNIHDCFDGISYRAMQKYSDTVDEMEQPAGAMYIDIHNNVFERCIDNAIETEAHARNLYIHDNYFHNITDTISVQPEHGTPWPTNIKVYKNVIHNTRDFNEFLKKSAGFTPKAFKIMIDKNRNWNSGYPWMSDYPLASDGTPSKIEFADEGLKIFNNTIVMPGGGLLNGLGSGVWLVPHNNIHFINNAVVCDVVCENPSKKNAKAQFDISYLKDTEFKNNFFAADSRMTYTYSDIFLQEGKNRIVDSEEMQFEQLTRLHIDPALKEGSPLIGAGWKDRHEPEMSRDVGALNYGEVFDISSAGCEQ